MNNKVSTPGDHARRPINDGVRTNPDFAKKIIEYFKPTGFCLEPCRGDGAFYNSLPSPKDWCEISEGKDFLDYIAPEPVNWIITNFPWSGKALRPLVRKACQLSNNVVHLIRIHNILGTFARQKDFLDQGHSLKEIIIVPWKDAFINKAPEGFALGVFHTIKNHKGDMKWTYWDEGSTA